MNDCIWKLENGTPLWEVRKGQEHRDDIEMSGLYVDDIVYYGTREDGTLALGAHRFSPMLRTIPNNTHATFCFTVKDSDPLMTAKNKWLVAHREAKSLVADGVTVGLTGENYTVKY